MAEAQEKLVERVVVGPKVVHYHHPETGERTRGEVGDTIHLPLRSAKAFARYLEAPEVAAAKAEVAEAEARANAARAEAEAGVTAAEAGVAASENDDDDDDDSDAGGDSDDES